MEGVLFIELMKKLTLFALLLVEHMDFQSLNYDPLAPLE